MVHYREIKFREVPVGTRDQETYEVSLVPLLRAGEDGKLTRSGKKLVRTLVSKPETNRHVRFRRLND